MNYSELQKKVIAQGACTNSKRPEHFIQGIYPTHVSEGKGCMLFDENGKGYIDYICGLGSNLFGYGNSIITDAVTEQLSRGSIYSFPHILEPVVAEKLLKIFPFGNKVRFFKNGTDATTVACRIARAYKALNNEASQCVVYSSGYHGSSDIFLSLTKPKLGVIEDWNVEPLTDDIFTCLGYGGSENISAVIVEPVELDYSESRKQYLQKLRDWCTKEDVCLIFDEIVTSPRFKSWAVCREWDIKPDILCIGKAWGGGLPFSAVIGTDKYMECGEYFASNTFSGDVLALAAVNAIIDKLLPNMSVDQLWQDGQAFLDQFNLFHPGIQITGYPTRGMFQGDENVKALFWQEACKQGVLFGKSWFFDFWHHNYTKLVLDKCSIIFYRIKSGKVKLEGKMPMESFKR